MKEEISNECKEFLKKLIEQGGYYYNNTFRNYYIKINIDGDILYYSDDCTNPFKRNKREITKFFKLFKSYEYDRSLPFTKDEMNYIFKELEKECIKNDKKQEDDRKSLLKKLNLTEDELQQLKTMLK